MSMVRKLLAIVMTLVLFASLPVFAQAQTVEEVALKVWSPATEMDITKQMCELFAQNHPEYKLTFEYAIMEVGDSINNLKKDAEDAADVFQYPSGGIPELTQAGLIYPITLDVDAIKAAQSETAITACTKDGLIYGIPFTPNCWFMYYDKSKYTQEEIRSLDAMLAKDLGEGVYNFSCSLDNSWFLEAFFYAAGCTLFGADGTDATECSWNNENGLQVTEYLLNLVKGGKYINDADGLALSLMKEGKLAALSSGTWSAADVKAALGDNYAAAMLPAITLNGEERQLSNFVDYKAYGVNVTTKHPKAAIQLATWLGGEECQKIRFDAVSSAPTIMSLLSDADVLANVEVAALAKQASVATPQPSTPKLADYWTPVAAFGSELVNGTLTLENAQEKLDSMVEGILGTLK